jgi:uncharacterized protein
MLVLNCPVCQSAMREVVHQGVTIDTCTRCRGVWLDRGELEKIAATVASGAPGGEYAPEPARFLDPAKDIRRPYRSDDDDDDDGRYRNVPQQKSKVSRFLDFFD